LLEGSRFLACCGGRVGLEDEVRWGDGVENCLDVLPLQKALHSVEEIVKEEVVKGRVILNGLGIECR
jgi:hypothetical protein